MKWKLGQKPTKPATERQLPTVQIRKLTNKAEILSYLEQRRSYAVTAIAHLEPGFPEISKWFVALNGENFALCLISRSMSPSYVLTMGNELTLDALLRTTPLPGEAFITCQPEHLDTVERYYELEWHFLMKRMVATRESFTPAAEEAIRLRPAQVNELNRLYKEHSSNVFSARQIRRGVYYGIWRDGQLVAVAGTHLISPTYGIAYVGNVLTHPAYRNQGLATICTSAVTTDLLDYCTEVVLNVEPQNRPAVQAYASLGYKDDCLIVEAIGRRKSFVGAIVTNLWKKLGLSPKYEERMETDG